MKILENYDQFAGRKKMIENQKKQLKKKQKELKQSNVKLQLDKATKKKKEIQAKLHTNDVGGADYYK